MPQSLFGGCALDSELPATPGERLRRVAVSHVRSRFAAGSGGPFKLAFATFVVLAALGFTYTAPDGSFPASELPPVLLRVMAISGLLFVAALALPPGRGVSNAALALATLAGVFTVYLVHTDLFHPSNRIWMTMVLAACLFALFTAFRVIDEFRWGGFALTVAAALAVAAAGWPEVAPKLLTGMRTPGGLLYVGSPVGWTALAVACVGSPLALYVLYKRVRVFRGGALALLTTTLIVCGVLLALGFKVGEDGTGHYRDGWEDHPKVRSVAFKETPNLYFLGFDSIVPEAIMRKYMEIETTDFHQLMEREMRRFRNLFANAVPTGFSFNTLMALDQDIYLEHSEARTRPPSYFAGHNLSPLVWLLRENGYETTSIYQDTFFGRSQGPGIDNYLVNRKSSLCSLLDEGIRTLAFWGYCWRSERERFSGPAHLTDTDFLVRHLTGIDSGSGPQFVIAHLYLPGHTQKMFDYDNRAVRARFLSDFEDDFNKAAVPLEQIIDHLRANDPDAILFVFGDHGARLSRGFAVEDDPAFFLHDRFGILGGVYPRDRCAPEFDAAEDKGYATSLDVVHAIIRCLSDGQSPLVAPRRDRFWGAELAEDHSYDYKEFLYE